MKRGLTLLELIIVIALLALLAAAAPVFSRFQSGNTKREALRETAQVLRNAQAKAAAGYHNHQHGVKLMSGNLIGFEGSDYQSRFIDYDRPTGWREVSLTWNLLGEGQADEIVFAKGSGRPSRRGSIDFAWPDGQIGRVTISALGLVEIIYPQ